MLKSESAIGVFVWNKTRREFNLETESWKRVRNPRVEWEVEYRRDLAVVPLELWRAARRKLAAIRALSPMTGKTHSCNHQHPTTLFSGTLFCACCNNELTLRRSTKKYKQLASLNGLHRVHGCQLSSSKSTKVIEDGLLGYLHDQVLTSTVVEGLVAQANAILEEESQKPCPDLGPLEKRADQVRQQIKRLIRKVSQTDDHALSTAYEGEIKRLQWTSAPSLMSLRLKQKSSVKSVL